MSNDVSRVYQFLATKGDWVSAADQDGDDKITKYEFRTFMYDNFDWESLDGWNGEESMQDDLINSFWKTIDTNQGGKISGTKLKNKNALDDKEIASMENKIAIYEIFNEYTAAITAPSVVSNASDWKNSVVQGLAALIEAYTGSAEDLEAYLDEHVESIMNKTTADKFATEYINSAMQDVVKEYGYSYDSDETLKGLIDAYVQNIPEGTTAEEIKETVTSIVDAYMATAGLKEDNAYDLSAYGYTMDESSPLNDLQKLIITKNLQNALEGVKSEADYATYADLYDTAINDYISRIVSEAKFGDFQNLKNQTSEAFLSSDEYNGLKNSITVKGLLQGDALYSKVSSEISSSLADLIKNDGRYLTVMTDIEAEVLEKVKAGDFAVNGSLDTNAVLDWVVQQIQSRIAEFYGGNLSNMTLSDLNEMYSQLYTSASEESDNDKSLQAHRDAAIKYCDALTDKSSTLANAVIDAFGEDYASAIQEMLPSQIKAKIDEIQAATKDFVDVQDLSLDSQNWGIADSITVTQGETEELTLSPMFKDSKGNVKTVTSDRITYTTSNSDIVTIDNTGKVSISSSAVGSYTVSITVLVDGTRVGTKTITINCKEKELTAEDILDKASFAGVGDPSGGHLEVFGTTVPAENTQVIDANFADLYNNNAIIQLHREKDTNGGKAKDRLSGLITMIIGALTNAGLDNDILIKAAEKVKNQYNNIERTSISNNWEKDTLARHAAGQIQNGTCTSHAIVNYADTKRRDYNVYMVSFRGLVDDIIAEYNKLA